MVESKNITVEMTEDDLMLVLTSLTKLQVVHGVPNKRVAYLISKLMIQAVDKLDMENLAKYNK